MPTLREAFDDAQVSLQKEITEVAAKTLRSLVAKTVGQIQGEYDNFFEVLYDEVINAGNLANTNNPPKIFDAPGVQKPFWAAVTPKWYAQKSRNQDPKSLEFYHGLTYGIIDRLVKKGKKKRGSGATRTGLSFDQFIQALSYESKEYTEELFGPLQISFTFRRPDGGAGRIYSLDDDSLRVIYRDSRGKTAKFMAGTVLSAQVSAFTKVNSLNTERLLIAYLIGKNEKYKNQWVKVIGVDDLATRAIILPLISYYTQYYFNLLLRNNLK